MWLNNCIEAHSYQTMYVPSSTFAHCHVYSTGGSKMDEQSREAELAGWVAAGIEHRKLFRQRAKTVADQLTPEQIEGLNQYFIYPKLPRKPKEAAGKFRGLGEWQSICQHAIFEIFYNRPDVTLNRVRQIAFG